MDLEIYLGLNLSYKPFLPNASFWKQSLKTIQDQPPHPPPPQIVC